MGLRPQPMIYNRTWDTVMQALCEETAPDAIVNSWWPPGHFITGVARRRVTFDGATLEKPVGYWISRIFLARQERYAQGVLRMLNLSGNRATEFLQGRGLALSEAVALIDQAVVLV